MNQQSHDTAVTFSQLSLDELMTFDVKKLLKSHRLNDSPSHQAPEIHTSQRKPTHNPLTHIGSATSTSPMAVRAPVSTSLLDARVMSGWVQLIDSSHCLDVFARGKVSDVTGTFEIFQDERLAVLLGSFVVGHPKTIVMIIRNMFCVQNGLETCTCRCGSPDDAEAWANFLCFPMFSSLPITWPEQLDEILRAERPDGPEHLAEIETKAQGQSQHGALSHRMNTSESQNTISSNYTAMDSIALTARADVVVQAVKSRYIQRKRDEERLTLRKEEKKKLVVDRDELVKLRAQRLKAQGIEEESYGYRSQKTKKSIQGQPSLNSLQTLQSTTSSFTQRTGEYQSPADKAQEKMRREREKNKSQKELFDQQVAKREEQLREEYRQLQLVRQREAHAENMRKSALLYKQVQEITRQLPPNEALLRAQASVVIQRMWRGTLVRTVMDRMVRREHLALAAQGASNIPLHMLRGGKVHSPHDRAFNIFIPSPHRVAPVLQPARQNIACDVKGGGTRSDCMQIGVSGAGGGVIAIRRAANTERRGSNASHSLGHEGGWPLTPVQEESHLDTTGSHHKSARVDYVPANVPVLSKDGASHQSVSSMVSDITDTDFNSHQGGSHGISIDARDLTEKLSVSVSDEDSTSLQNYKFLQRLQEELSDDSLSGPKADWRQTHMTSNEEVSEEAPPPLERKESWPTEGIKLEKKGGITVVNSAGSEPMHLADSERNEYLKNKMEEKKKNEGLQPRSTSEHPLESQPTNVDIDESVHLDTMVGKDDKSSAGLIGNFDNSPLPVNSEPSPDIERTVSMTEATITVERMGEYNILREPGLEPRTLTNEELDEYLKQRKKAKKKKKKLLKKTSLGSESYGTDAGESEFSSTSVRLGQPNMAGTMEGRQGEASAANSIGVEANDSNGNSELPQLAVATSGENPLPKVGHDESYLSAEGLHSPKAPPLDEKRSGNGSLRLKNMGFSFRMNFLPKS